MQPQDDKRLLHSMVKQSVVLLLSVNDTTDPAVD
jgi:hypothetical protein